MQISAYGELNPSDTWVAPNFHHTGSFCDERLPDKPECAGKTQTAENSRSLEENACGQG